MEQSPDSAAPAAEAATPEDEAVTLSIVRRVRPGREREYEQILNQMIEVTRTWPGFRDARIFRPTGGSQEYRIIVWFDSKRELRAWSESPERQALLDQTTELTEDEPTFANITGTAQEAPLAMALTPLDQFVRTSVSGIGLLLLGTVAAMVFANTPFSAGYEAFWNIELTIGTAGFGITESLRYWVNDALMALFFFIVGLEIKREVLVGEMRYPRQAALAIAAAVGGVVLPALIFVGLNLGGPGQYGWGVPIGTDTAFALGIVTLFGSRVRPVLLVFLTAFAIVDDILAVGVIAIFYTDSISWVAAGIALALLGVLVLANRAGFHRWPVYAVLGVGVWIAVFESGIHATAAGVLVAMAVPARSWINPSEFLVRSRRLIDDFERACYIAPTILTNEPQQQATLSLSRLVEDVETPMTYFQHRLNPWVAYGILPIFAFANAGIPLFDGIGEAVSNSVTWGVAAGLVFGKPLGITLFAWLAVRLGIARLPRAMNWQQIAGVAALGGVGFTISLFITELAFGASELAHMARIGIVIGSVIAAIFGYIVLNATLPPPRDQEASG